MSKAENDCCAGDTILIFPCSGASNTGEMTDRAARLLSREGAGKMFCLAGIGGRIESFINSTREADKVLVLDGCSQDCAKKTMEEAGIKKFLHVRITDLDLVKGKSPVNEENTRVVTDKGKELLA